MSVSAIPHVESYDTQQFPLAEMLRQLLDVTDFTACHEALASPVERLTVDSDQSTPLHSRFYDAFPRFEQMYVDFVRLVAARLIGGSATVYQRVPTFRVHLPGNVAVGEFHTDADYGHVPGEINIWVPLVNSSGSCSVWIESEPDAADYKPWDVKLGEYLVFDGARLRHGNQLNDTGRTRVSFDFRIAEPATFRGSESHSITHSLPLKVGGYFQVLDTGAVRD